MNARTITIFLILILALPVFSHAKAQDAEILCAVDAGDQGVSIFDSIGGRKIGTMEKHKPYPVTDEGDAAWTRIQFDADGTQGYVSVKSITREYHAEDYVETRDAVFSVSGDLSARPGSLAYAKDLSVSGVITSSLPLSFVEISVYNDRALCVEATSRAVFFRNDGVTKFDLSTLIDGLQPNKLSSGEKTLIIKAGSGSHTQVLAENRFYIEGNNGDDAHITRTLQANDERALIKVTDENDASGWRPLDFDTLSVTLPEDADAAVVTVEWKQLPETFTLAVEDGKQNELTRVTVAGDEVWYVHDFTLPDGARVLSITQTDPEVALSELRVYAKGRVPENVQRWQKTPEKMELMILSAHQDDEFLFFGGSIPYYAEKGRAVGVIYMANCGRDRYAEALDALWVAGLRRRPVFLGLQDKKTETLSGAQRLWKGDAVVELLVEQLRKYKPEVIVTHDLKGEYLHYQHIVTVNAVVRAIELAADEMAYPDSAARYGTWNVKKLYVHLYKDNAMQMNWDVPSVRYPGMTIRDVFYMAYDKNYTQTFQFSVRISGTRYDNSKFGLYYSAVGEDVQKNDFFENLP